MSKLYVFLGALIVMAGLLINYVFGYDKTVEESDEEIAMMHMTKVYEDDYENMDVIICDDTTGERIHYEGYADGKLVCDTYIYRDAAYDCLTGRYDDIHD